MKPFQLWHSVSVIQIPNILLSSPLTCSLLHRFCNKNVKLIICENNVNIFHLNISLIINAFSTFIWNQRSGSPSSSSVHTGLCGQQNKIYIGMHRLFQQFSNLQLYIYYKTIREWKIWRAVTNCTEHVMKS